MMKRVLGCIIVLVIVCCLAAHLEQNRKCKRVDGFIESAERSLSYANVFAEAAGRATGDARQLLLAHVTMHLFAARESYGQAVEAHYKAGIYFDGNILLGGNPSFRRRLIDERRSICFIHGKCSSIYGRWRRLK